jgi:hypothetical protein
VELIRALQDNNWRVFIISWVGSSWRAQQAWQEMVDAALIDVLGASSIMILDPKNHGERSHKAVTCDGNRINVTVDDSPEVYKACVERNIVCIPIQGGQQFPDEVDAYHNLEQALAVEGILYRKRRQDR